MSQSRNKIIERLKQAQQVRQPVSVRRKHLEAYETSGFVVALTDEWVVLQDLVETAYLDALVLLRLDLVTKVKKHDNHTYVSRAVTGLGVPIDEFTCPPDAKVGDLLRIIDDRAEFVLVCLETTKEDWHLVGKILHIGEKRLDLYFVGRDGVWTDCVDAWRLKDITRMVLGGRYIRALEQFSEPRPSMTKRVKR